MRRLLLTACILGSSLILFAQPPEGYYTPAMGLSGEDLKTALFTIIKDHTEFPYTASSTDTWDILKESDRDPDNAENVILFYTGWSVNAAQEYNNEKGWNREHVWAKSRGDFGTAIGPGTDTHNLRPSDISVNFARGNRWFDNCTIPVLDEGLETGCYISNTDWVWQPRDEVKGDVARMIFYMATRYEGENGEPDLVVIDYLPSNDFTYDPIHAKLGTLLEWHQEDSVSSFEQNRNEVIFGYKGNRNPFVDHPEYVYKIWGSGYGVSIDNTMPDHFRIYPNPVHDLLTISFKELEEYTIEINSLNGQVLYRAKTSASSFQIDLSSFPRGLYLINIRTNEFVNTKKILLQ